MLTIYKITNLQNGRVYVGSTLQKPSDRWDQHARKLNRRIHPNPGLQKDYNITGNIKNFEFSILCQQEVSSKEQRAILERSYEKKYDNTYNRGSTGKGDYTTSTGISILQLSLDGNILNKYKSIREASRALQVDPAAIQYSLSDPSNSQCKSSIFIKESDYDPLSPVIYQPGLSTPKAVLQFTLDGKFIKKYDSVNSVPMAAGSSIHKAIMDPFHRTCKGCLWILETDYQKLNNSGQTLTYKGKLRGPTSVLQLTPQGAIVKRFDTVQQASLAIGLSTSSSLSYALVNPLYKLSKGFMWIKESEYNEYKKQGIEIKYKGNKK